MDCKSVLSYATTNLTSPLQFVLFDYYTVYIRVYADEAYQNLAMKHSQVVYIITLSDHAEATNVVHWHSVCASRQFHSTEEAELLALDLAFREIQNMRMSIFQLLNKEVPIVADTDIQTL